MMNRTCGDNKEKNDSFLAEKGIILSKKKGASCDAPRLEERRKV